MRKIVKVTGITILLMMMILCIFMIAGCENHNKKPWWEDRENLEFVLEDERSDEKSFSHKLPYSEKITFHYTFDSANTEEYIPKVKILHNGVEKMFYTYVYKREWFYLKPDGFDYDDPHRSAIIKDPGAYRVSLHFYQNKVDADKLQNLLDTEVIYIIVNKGGEHE